MLALNFSLLDKGERVRSNTEARAEGDKRTGRKYGSEPPPVQDASTGRGGEKKAPKQMQDAICDRGCGACSVEIGFVFQWRRRSFSQSALARVRGGCNKSARPAGTRPPTQAMAVGSGSLASFKQCVDVLIFFPLLFFVL